jgi:hypothetical protein
VNKYLNFHAGTLLLVFVDPEALTADGEEALAGEWEEALTGDAEEAVPLPGERVPLVGAG